LFETFLKFFCFYKAKVKKNMKYIAAFVVAFMTLLLSGRDVAAGLVRGDVAADKNHRKLILGLENINFNGFGTGKKNENGSDFVYEGDKDDLKEKKEDLKKKKENKKEKKDDDSSSSDDGDDDDNSSSSAPSSEVVEDNSNCVVIDDNGCEPGAPHFDPQGMVCKNDGQADEAHCNYDYGPNACVVCGCEIYDDNGCEPGAPHFDPQGMVCANDGQEDEAYCNYNFGPNACVIGCRSFSPTSAPSSVPSSEG